MRDGQKTSEMAVKVQESWRKLLKNPPPSTRSSSVEEPVAASPAVQTPASPKGPENAIRPSPVTIGPPTSRRSARQGATPPASERITSPNQPPAAIEQPKPAVQPQPEEKPELPESPAVKEKNAQINKLISEMNASDESKTDELFKQVKALGEIMAAQSANDVNK